MTHILSIETSCDDTSVAVVREDRRVLACLTASQDLEHAPFGGIVPEIASRNHTAHILPLIEKALGQSSVSWSEIDGIAVTSRPGLVGSLIVGLVTAKTLAVAKDKPFLGVHHIEGHIMAPFLVDDYYRGPDFYKQDFIALIVSGGHTQLYRVQGFGQYETLGETIDDAAGEAFDKFAKMLGLPYPGGVQVDRLAQDGDAKAFVFPKPLLKDGTFNFSFSGLKSAAQRMIEKMTQEQIEQSLPDLCASYQKVIVDVLSFKLEKALDQYGIDQFVVSGGVSANSALRLSVKEIADRRSAQVALPPLRYCTDNAAMIGLVGLLRMENGEESSHDLAPLPRASL